MSVSEVDPSELVVTKAWDSSLFRRLLEFIRPHRRLFLASFAVLMCLFAGELFGTWIWRGAIDGPVTGAAGAEDRSPYVRELLGWVGLYVGPGRVHDRHALPGDLRAHADGPGGGP